MKERQATTSEANNLTFQFKRFVLQSRVGSMVQELRAKYHSIGIGFQSEELKNKHVLTISPYKTGTTFLANCYKNLGNLHEPLHYLSVKYPRFQSQGFFEQRLNYLNLPLECSGFMCRNLSYFKQCTSSKLQLICLGRYPSQWITSIINYWKLLNDEGYREADYVDCYFWQPILGETIYNFFLKETRCQEMILKKLEDFYLEFTQDLQAIPAVRFIMLENVVEHLSEIDELVGAKSNSNTAWQRKNKSSYFKHNNSMCDREYDLLVNNLLKKPIT